MKKSFFYLFFLMGLIMTSFAFVSCGEDSDDDNPLVGTWYTYDGEGDYTEITYKSDMTCTWKEFESDKITLKDIDYGRYQIDGDVLSIWYDSDEDNRPWFTTFIIKGNKMITTEAGGTTWTRK